jgi:hypothetical protein
MVAVGIEPETVWILGKFANLWKRNDVIRLILAADDNDDKFLLKCLLFALIKRKKNQVSQNGKCGLQDM